MAGQAFHFGIGFGVRTAHSVGINLLEIKGLDGLCQRHAAHLAGECMDAYAVCGEGRFGQSAGGHTHCGLAGRRASAAAVVADAVFHLVGVVGVRGTVDVAEVVVVRGALVQVFNQQRNRGACGDAVEHAGKDVHAVGLVASR